MSDSELENANQQRVTDEMIEEQIKSIQHHHMDGNSMVCSIVLKNGFSVRGSVSCVDPADFDSDKAMELSLEKAKKELYPFFGFMLAEDKYRSSNK
ncbi:MAG: hypothetical protein MI685_09505 [Chlorobiales bacterium]|nr:hypothetical protein [Chlorobiales bacterium]